MELGAQPTTVWEARGDETIVGTSVRIDRDGNKRVLVTTRDQIRDVDAISGDCIHQWSFRSGSPLALRAAAVRNPVSNVYYGIRGGSNSKSTSRSARDGKLHGQSLVTWEEKDTEPAKWTSVVLESPYAQYFQSGSSASVLSLLVHPQLKNEVAVAFTDGTFAVYNSALEHVVDAQELEDTDTEYRTLWADLSSDHRSPTKGTLFLSLVIEDTYSLNVELYVYRLERPRGKKAESSKISSSLALRVPLTPPVDGATLQTAAFHAEIFAYSFVWSTGQWEMAYCHHDTVHQTLSWTRTETVSTIAPESNTDNISKKKKTSPVEYKACGVGFFSYLMLTSSTSTDLTGWDAKFKVKVASTSLSDQSGSIVDLQSSFNGEVVVAAYAKKAVVVDVRNKHSSLANVLGANAHATYSTAASMDFDTLISGDKPPTNEEEAIDAILDTDKTKTKAAISKRVHGVTSDSMSYSMAVAVAQRTVLTPDLALWQLLTQALQTKLLSTRAIPKLLPTLLQQKQSDVLDACVQHLIDIDEKSVVQLAKHFLHASVRASSARRPKKETSKTLDEGNETSLMAVLALPANPVFLRQAVKHLPLNDVVLLLAVCQQRLLTALAENDSDATDITPRTRKRRSLELKQENLAQPSARQVVNWVCVLLDAHFTSLVVAAASDESIATSIQKMNELVQKSLEWCDAFEGVQSVLGNFLNGVPLPQTHGIPDYSIEELVM